MLSSRCEIFALHTKIWPFRILIRLEEDSDLTIFASNNETTLLRSSATWIRHIFIIRVACSAIRVDRIDRKRFFSGISGRNTFVIAT